MRGRMSEGEQIRKATPGRQLSGLLVTLATLAVIEFLSRTVPSISAPAPLYVAAVAWATYSGGLRSGLMSAALTLLHAGYFFSMPGQLFRYTKDDAVRTTVLATILLLVVLLLGELKRRADRVATIAQDNAILKGQMMERGRIAEAAKTLAQVGRRLVEPLDFSSAADRVGFAALHLFGATRSVLYRLDQSSGYLVCVATAGEGDPGKWIGQTLPSWAGIAGQAIADRRVIWVADLLTHPGIPLPPGAIEHFQEEGYRSVVALPLIARGKTLGALVLAAPGSRTLTDEGLWPLSIFSDQAALALENASLYGELEAALEQLKASQARIIETERLGAVEELAGQIAHHLNNLLTAILFRIQLALPKVEESELRRALELVERRTLEGADMIRRLLGFTEARPPSEASPLDLSQLAQEAVEMTQVWWQDEARFRGIQIQLSADLGSTGAVRGERTLLSEVLINLLRNAVEALPQGGTITVRTWVADEWVYCSVADTGAGMSSEVRHRAVEPFFTSKGPRRVGLGLSLSHGIIQRHRGTLAIESTEGKGTVVTIRLPRARPGQ